MLRKLQSRPPTTSDISALTELLRCTREGVCKDVGRLSKVFEAGVAHPSPNNVLLSAYGEFAEHLLRDSALAEKLFREALAVAPGEPTTHENVITFLIHHGRFDEARAERDALRRMNHLGALDSRIARLDAELSAARSSQTSGVEGDTGDTQSRCVLEQKDDDCAPKIRSSDEGRP
jgi:hypothetical protein